MQNIGTLITSAIRPNDSNDLIASAFANEIKGGNHGYATLLERNSLIEERREWGMLCTIYNDGANNGTYQLSYGYQNVDINDNTNWILFSGAGGSGNNSDWLDSVKEIRIVEPTSNSEGDRYLLGLDSTNILTGANWSSTIGGAIAEWKSSINNWDYTFPNDGSTLRVNNIDNVLYKYEGTFSSGLWNKESLNSIKSVVAITTDGLTYSSVVSPSFDLENNLLFLTTFNQTNNGAVNLNINGMGSVPLKKIGATGLGDLRTGDLLTNVLYNITYDSGVFQLSKPFNSELFNNKYIIENDEYIYVPVNTQYWIYGDLTLRGTLDNDGLVVIANGALDIQGGTFSGSGILQLITLEPGTVYENTDTIDFSVEHSILSITVSATVKNDSLTSSHLNTSSNGGATAGYILSVDESGNFKWLYNSSTSLYWGTYDKDIVLTSDIFGDNQSTGITITYDVVQGSYVSVTINGLEYRVGDGDINKPFYFSSDSGVTAKTFNNIQSGDILYFNQTHTGHELLSDWILNIKYSK